MRQLQRNRRLEVTVNFNASGIATATINVPVGPSLEVRQISVKTNLTANETVCSTYIGFSSSGIFISTSYTGNADTDSEPNVTLRSGDALTAVWTGGASGFTATLTAIVDEVPY